MIILAINTVDVRLPSCLDYLVPLLAHTFNFSVIICSRCSCICCLVLLLFDANPSFKHVTSSKSEAVCTDLEQKE